jgi:thiamine-phosphate pyrophosphorylase
MTLLPFDILVITDRFACERVERTVEGAIAPLLQSPLCHRVAVLIRDKSVPQTHVAETIQRLLPMTQSAGAKLLVHTHVDLALAFGLDGVHVASDIGLAPFRCPGLILGVSRHSQDPLDAADIGLADYATMSPIYRPTSKPDDSRQTLGVLGLETCVQRSVRPLVALGGLQPGRVAGVIQSGAEAIALSGAILQAKEPAEMLHQLCAEIDMARFSDVTRLIP